MKLYKYYILCFAFSISTLFSYTQTIKQLNAIFTIGTMKSIGGNQYEIAGAFLDGSNTFVASQIVVGDQIIDKNGNAYKIVTITSISGSTVSTVCLDLNGVFPVGGQGIIFRPSSNGYPLIATNTPASVLSIAVNTMALGVNSDLPTYNSGLTLPVMAFNDGDVVVNSIEAKVYRLTGSTWVQNTKTITSSFASSISSVSIGATGALVYLRTKGTYFVSNGNAWFLIPFVSALPSIPKFGDVYYKTGEKKLFMLSDATNGSEWMAISGTGIPGGGTVDFPVTPKPGDLFFNTDNNTLYVFDNNSTWVEVSTNGSNPAGFSNPDNTSPFVKEGQLFYNTSEHRLYVYNGTGWLPVGNSLTNNQIYVGNSSNIATSVALSGDASITSVGRLTISNLAITNEKLDKVNIPLSGYGNPISDINMGDGTTNYKIVNLQNPSALQDAATKAYVDNSLVNPSANLALANGNLFIGNSLNKAAAVAKSIIPLSGFGNPVANISMNGKLITNLASPSNDADAVNKFYVDSRAIWPINIGLDPNMLLMGNAQGKAGAVEKRDISFSDFGAGTADVSIGGFKITNIAEPVAAQDAATKNYIDTKVIDPTNISLSSGNLFVGNSVGRATVTLKNAIPLSGFGAATTDVSLGGSRILSVGAPIGDTDASNKKYVDDLLLNPVNTLSLPAGNFFVGNTFGKATPTLKSAVPISGFGKATENIYLGDPSTQYSISYLKEPMDPKDAATKNYVDTKNANPSSIVLATGYVLVGNATNQAEAIAKNSVSLSDFGAVNVNLSLENYKITNLSDPVNDGDAVNKKYVTTQLSSSSSLPSLPSGQLFLGNTSGKATAVAKNTIPISGFGDAVADVVLGSHKITNLADPTADQDATTKIYVDSKLGSVPSGTTPPSSPSPGNTFYNTTDKIYYVYDGTQWVPVDNTLPNGQLYVGDASGKATATLKNAISLSGFGAALADISMGSKHLTDLATPVSNADAATKAYVDAQIAAPGHGDNLGNHTASANLKMAAYTISNDGALGKGLSFDATGNATFEQSVTINGDFYTPSDQRLKTKVETLSRVLQDIDKIRGVRFEYKDQKKYAAGPKIGVIAQELQLVFPEMVSKGSDGFLKVDYTQLTGILIQAIKEQEQQIKQQQQEINVLRERINNQQLQIDTILKKIQ